MVIACRKKCYQEITQLMEKVSDTAIKGQSIIQVPPFHQVYDRIKYTVQQCVLSYPTIEEENGT